LKRCLEERRQEHQARKTTSTGPHTDDLDFTLDGQTTRSFGSQGQLRALILAFKIAQIEDTFDKLGQYPVLLLDDVSSELDNQRNTYLFDYINKIPCQSFVTTTRSSFVLLPDERVDYQVVKGNIRYKY
jgi:DNA replication and repair protein RecF